jgi:Flp pilus assembly protein TadB
MKFLNIFFPEEKTKEFDAQLRAHFSVSLEGVCRRALMLGAVLSILFLFAAFFLGFGMPEIVVAFIALLLLPPLIAVLYYAYLLERREKRLESEAQLALLQASVFQKGTPVSRIIGFLARKGNGLIGKEFLKAKKEIGKGASVEEALEKFRERNHGIAMERLADILRIAYESGECMGERFRELAEEITEMQAITAEKKAVLAMEKATLLMGSAVIVPFILGILTGLVSEFGFEGMEIAGFSSGAQRAELLAVAATANQVYIIEYALIASVFLAWIEGTPKKALVYALVLVPLSTAVFFLSRGFSVL